MTASGQLERQSSRPEDDLKAISNDTLVNSLVRKYWSTDLKANEIRSKANKFFGSGKFDEALKLYNDAFEIAQEDHFILSNRSLTHLRLGDTKAALKDAEMAISMRPDWPKGYLRKGMALRLLGLRNEAFKAFFACLTLETGNTRPAKLELAKELHHLLKTSSATKANGGPLSPSSSAASLTTLDSTCDKSDTSLSDLADFKTTDLPECLLELGQFLDIIANEDSENPIEDLPAELHWILVNEGQTIAKPTR